MAIEHDHLDIGSRSSSPSRQYDDPAKKKADLDMQEEQLRRGLVVMEEVTKARNEGRKFTVKWNNKNQVVDSHNCISYIGVAAKSLVPITLKSWKNATPAMKDAVWRTLTSGFEIEERHKKSFVTRKFFTNPDIEGIEDTIPSLISTIVNEDEWKAFVNSRRNPEFKALSAKNKEFTKKNEYTYKAGCKGYAGIEKGLIEKEQASEGSISRGRIWAKARKNKAGNIDNPKTKAVVETIEALAGTQTIDEDILEKALGNTNHPGRVRGVGFGVTRKEYFGDAFKRGKKAASSAEVQELRQRASGTEVADTSTITTDTRTI
ncbi:uncharacterized protein LOC129290703 [Prosopis cineraria]|uniref:uncharacterized protein LOC129290703 n=1 Tax=Prosopis cineraria TaxID=364024 RepID=UPI00240F5C5A|nr:uncharacterized protein LOC129290703 [Prosopis cineraria]